jgi:hypothetical protein
MVLSCEECEHVMIVFSFYFQNLNNPIIDQINYLIN